MRRINLRVRIILIVVLIVTATSVLFAAGVLEIKQRLEETTFGKVEREQLQSLLNYPEAEKIFDGRLLKGRRFYAGDRIRELPESVRQLAPGSYHALLLDDRYYHIEIAEVNGDKVYLSLDVTEWEYQEHYILRLMMAGSVLVLVLALVLGEGASRAILQPIRQFAKRLATASPSQRSLRLAEEFRGNEIYQIALAFDSYQKRLDEFVRREQLFTAAASHELRTPLSVIVGAVDILEANSVDPKAIRATERIQRACREMQAFVEASLFLSRETDSMVSAQQETKITDVLNRVLEDNQPILFGKQIEIDTDYTVEIRLCQPRSLLQIALGNIIRNAIEHTEKGRIELKTLVDQVIIRDTGEGIAAENLHKVCERSYSTKPLGSGLGLNLVKRICDRFDWQLEIESSPGRGTEVSIRFPSA